MKAIKSAPSNLSGLRLKVPDTNYIRREFLDPRDVFLWQALSQPAKVEKKALETAPASTRVPAIQEDDDKEDNDDDVDTKSKNKKKKKKGFVSKEEA
jgi:hypothetical protein